MTGLAKALAALALLLAGDVAASACDCAIPLDRERAVLSNFREVDLVAKGRWVRPPKLPKVDGRSVGHAEYRIEESWKGAPVGTVIQVEFTLSEDPAADCTHGKPKETEFFLVPVPKPGTYRLTPGCSYHPTQALLDIIHEERSRREEAAKDGDAAALTELGQFYRRYGFRGEAIQTFQRLLAMDPADPWAMRALGDAYLAADRIREAIEMLERATMPAPMDGKNAILFAHAKGLSRRVSAGSASSPGARDALSLSKKDFRETEFLDLTLS
ncbi:tetratricopeptide repeat protein [Siculibacillus lacustris]|uniref:Tetratricopeptide repeat protein n=1 Tax=Siculibacillus lacustris TaxID=1549641 RepID=A0A4Q9VHI2_9HYPH|nr:tetratricopeptide repeat protein [Siculibacillus lacustris]TBW34602.1 tetratricopeptide repeat protein [Siculibacillus lacustris]